MNLTDLINQVFVRSGQFILGDLSLLGLNLTTLWPLVQTELKLYQRYIPCVKQFPITTFGDLPYDFTNDQNNVGFNNTDLDDVILGPPPVMVQKAGAIRSLFQINIMQLGMSNLVGNQRNIADPHRTRYPMMLLWDYRSPFLYVTSEGTFDCIALYNYVPLITSSTTNNVTTITEVKIQGLDDGSNIDPEAPEVLIELVTGKFLQVVGRSRRAFTHSDLIITTDAADLVREGTDMYKAALEDLNNKASWWRAYKV